MIAGILVFSIDNIQYANSELQADQIYQLHALGFYSDTKSIGNSVLDLKFAIAKESGNNRNVEIKEGIANLSGQQYTLSGNVKATFLADDRWLILSTDAKNIEGKLITIRISGKLVENIGVGSVYSFTGKIEKDNQSMKIVYVAKIVGLEPPKEVSTQEKETGNKSTNETKQEILKLMLITKQWDRVQVSDSYRITAKVYDADKNPTKDFDQNWGGILGVKIISKIIDSNGVTVKSLEGITDQGGYFSNGFKLPDNFKPGTYKVIVTAEKDGFTTSNELTLHVEQFYLR